MSAVLVSGISVLQYALEHFPAHLRPYHTNILGNLPWHFTCACHSLPWPTCMIAASDLITKRAHDPTMKISSRYRRGSHVFIDQQYEMTMTSLGRYIARRRMFRVPDTREL
jgi:hypothetical protein